ncbi:hypothetical protein [Aneurinibacillus tyrosinisolvens]|jgi:hypothetical protein|uniref:hypothetical protein n=1 Tax=Aneurinibacillus tyrosinisolvens TaxID=1443435 RepID=UPI00063FD2AC|nr:hypothetical protein [Aneurinibacillus tyrosinisolvens]
MAKIITIYKEDNWNMITAEMEGAKITVREISTQWGEDTFVFNGRHEMMAWVEKHFTADNYPEHTRIVEAFQQI